MLIILKSHSKMIFICTSLVSGAAVLQACFPFLIALILSDIIERKGFNIEALSMLGLAFVLKLICQTCFNILNPLLEIEVRFGLIRRTCANGNIDYRGKFLTLIKEDSERASSSITTLISGVGAAALTIATALILVAKTPSLVIPLLALLCALHAYIRIGLRLSRKLYTQEISQEELYKSNIVKLIKCNIADTDLLSDVYKSLDQSIHLKFAYEQITTKLSGYPDVMIASSSIIGFGIGLFIQPGLLGPQTIIFLSCFGLFSLGAIATIQAAISISSAKISFQRLQECHNEPTLPD